jgi:hypothetical protein
MEKRAVSSKLLIERNLISETESGNFEGNIALMAVR